MKRLGGQPWNEEKGFRGFEQRMPLGQFPPFLEMGPAFIKYVGNEFHA